MNSPNATIVLVGKRADSKVGNNINSNKMELWVFLFFFGKKDFLECDL